MGWSAHLANQIQRVKIGTHPVANSKHQPWRSPGSISQLVELIAKMNPRSPAIGQAESFRPHSLIAVNDIALRFSPSAVKIDLCLLVEGNV